MRAYENEPVVIQRDVEAVMVPVGPADHAQDSDLPAISRRRSAAASRSMSRAICIGSPASRPTPSARKWCAPPQLPPDATEEDVRELAWEQMRSCYDPEIPINIVDLGLVYECKVTPNEDQSRDVSVTMTLTAPGCGMGDVLVQDVKEKLAAIPTVRQSTSS